MVLTTVNTTPSHSIYSTIQDAHHSTQHLTLALTSGAGGRVSKNLLRPKSVSFKCPSAQSRMFSGLRSRYTMSMSCKCCKAMAT